MSEKDIKTYNKGRDNFIRDITQQYKPITPSKDILKFVVEQDLKIYDESHKKELEEIAKRKEEAFIKEVIRLGLIEYKKLYTKEGRESEFAELCRESERNIFRARLAALLS